MDENYLLLPKSAIEDLCYLARQAAVELRERETVSPLADALNGAVAAVMQPVDIPA